MKKSSLRYLAPFGNPWAVAAESLMMPALAVGLGIWLNPLDPLWTNAPFHWAWFAPVILALRYGPFAGLAGAGVLLLAWIAFHLTGWLPGDFPKLNFLGGLILVMIAGESSSLWLARARRAEGVQVYLDQRLEYLTHKYYLLRLSHDRLEQDLIGRPMAMRDALGTLQNPTRNGDDPRLAGASHLLRLLAQYCQIEVAAIYAANENGFDIAPVAGIGQSRHDGQLVLDDPLVRHVQTSGQLSHIAATDEPEVTSRYIIVAPLTTFSGETLGLLAVEHMPFFALHTEMMQTMRLLLGYFSDGLKSRQLSSEIQTEFPACPVEFAAELQRLWRVRQESGVVSVIVALEFSPQAGFEDLAAQIRRQRRSLDINWLIEKPEKRILVTLMPLADNAAAEGYMARIIDWLHHLGKETLEEAGVFPHVLRIDETAPIPLLRQLHDIYHVSA